MTLTKLKAKNQLTIPSEVVKKLRLKINELFTVELEKDYIKLTPVDVEPRYTSEELDKIRAVVEKEKKQGVTVKSPKEFSTYVKKIIK